MRGPTPETTVLDLALVAGFTQAEIGGVLGLPVGTVMSRTLNGMRALRTAVGERGFEPPEGQADLAHREAADWVLGTLKPPEDAYFWLHLTGCPHCRAAVAEFGELAQMLQHLPRPVAAPGTEPFAIADVLAAAAEGEAAAHVYQSPEAYPPAAGSESTQASEIRLGPSEPAHNEQPAGTQVKVSQVPTLAWPPRPDLRCGRSSSRHHRCHLAVCRRWQCPGEGRQLQAWLAFRAGGFGGGD